MDIINKHRDRLDWAEDHGLEYQLAYENILAELATIRLDKANTYGEERYRETDADLNMGGVFWDVGRKWRRLRRMFQLGWRKMAHHPDGLRQVLLDMANYCIMGIQLMDQYHPAPKRSPFFIEQVALSVPDPEGTKGLLMDILGLDQWSHDVVEGAGRVLKLNSIGQPKGWEEAQNKANLSFNYQLGQFELELIRYEEGDNWLQSLDRPTNGLSHLGVHVPPGADMDKVIQRMQDNGMVVAQDITTTGHTNPAIKDSRRYRYVIFDSRRHLGFDLKLIQRLGLDGRPL